MMLPDCPPLASAARSHLVGGLRIPHPLVKVGALFFPAYFDDVRKKMYICGVNDLNIKNFYITNRI